MNRPTRRSVLRVAAALPLATVRAHRAPSLPRLAFTKPFQDLDFDALGALVASLGFDGVELPVRARGAIEPERAADELPAAAEALARHGVRIGVVATDVVAVDTPFAERVLATAARSRVPRFRTSNYVYVSGQPPLARLDALRPQVRELAAWSAELGLTGMIQNHSGARYVGSALWDLDRLLDDVAPAHLGVAFDLGHATVEGGLTWPNHVALLRPRFAALYAKDFRWSAEQTVEWVPLGEGRSDLSFYGGLAATDFRGPLSVHVEYLHGRPREEVAAAFARDLATLDRALGS